MVSTEASSAPPPKLGLGGQMKVGISLSLAMAMPPFVQYGVAVLAPFLVEDLGISRAQIGTLVSVSFTVALLSSSWLGRLADAVGGRIVIALLFVAGALSLALLGVAPTFPWLVVAVVAAGLSMGAANPATNQLVAAFIPVGQRGLLMGAKQSGVKLGQMLSAASLPSLASAVGWRTSLFIGSMGAAIVGALVLLALPGFDNRGVQSRRARSRSSLPSFLPALVTYGFLMGLPQGAFGAYLPLYAFENLGFTAAVGGAVAATVGLVGMMSRIAWGRAAERFESLSSPLVLIALGTGLSLVLTMMADFAGRSWIVWFAAVIFGATAPVWAVIAMLAVVSAVEGDSTGRSSGLVLSGLFAGFIIGPIAFGIAVDRSGSYALGWWLAFGCTIMAAVVARFASELHRSVSPRHPTT